MTILDRFRLDGKTALVTGAASGLGAAIAVAMAEAGASVACHGNRRPADNAGMIYREAAEDYDTQAWMTVLQVNLNSVFRLCQLAGRAMLERRQGKIINIASLLSFQGGIRVPA